MPHSRQKAGNYGEELAVKFLKQKGFEIVEQNYRFGHGEIDIVAKENNTLVIVEVKYRNNLEFGPPELAITKTKQKQVRYIAEMYVNQKEKTMEFENVRIDVIAILKLPNHEPQINHIVNAF